MYRLHFEAALKLFSLFKIPYQSFVNIELLFALRLHITPLEMWEMPFYDIMLLYNAYSDYVDKENEQHEKEQARYEEQYQEQKDAMNINKYKNSMPEVNSITRGMMNGSQFKMPKF